ncbi:DASH complex subunit dam1, variant 2 [Ascochyta rabiei]|uniref:DASH complex subunit dam1, variant 2 n=1 Tax=Didymella rabiei TaxID=5454 RepID=UPI0021FC0550|nr:DASH complex subunit dam1, variant 2 [Ascochyta rabiei]UPX19174.1 DASH complex subunit dam1, variant 2 [Ascochyta rabiei]
MASTTPTREPPSSRDRRLRSRSPRSRPTTPLRPASRSSLRDSAQRSRGAPSSHALDRLQDGFAELSDAMADLEQNFVQLQLMHESLARFTESFAGFLYGMNMNAFCVDFPEVGIAQVWVRNRHGFCFAKLEAKHFTSLRQEQQLMLVSRHPCWTRSGARKTTPPSTPPPISPTAAHQPSTTQTPPSSPQTHRLSTTRRAQR